MVSLNLKNNLIALYGYDCMGVLGADPDPIERLALGRDLLRINNIKDPVSLYKLYPPIHYMHIIYRPYRQATGNFNIRKKRYVVSNNIYMYTNTQNITEFKTTQYVWEKANIIEVAFIHSYKITKEKECGSIPVRIKSHILYVNNRVEEPRYYRINKDGLEIKDISNGKFRIYTHRCTSDILNYTTGTTYQFKTKLYSRVCNK